MLKRLKNHNDSMFVIFLILLLGSSTWLFSNNVAQKITLLESEIQKIDKQQVFFTKQNKDLQQQRDMIVNNVNDYVELEKNLSENNTEELKKNLSENSKSSELLAILPPSEIANIQQKESLKKIQEDINSFKQKSAFVWQSINKLNSQEFSENEFVVGNIQDNSVKNVLANDISSLLKKEKPIFNSIATLNQDIENFSSSTENFKQFYPLLTSHQEKNKKTLRSTINSLSEELATIQLVSLVGLISLSLLLGFIIFRKKTKATTSVLADTVVVEQPTILHDIHAFTNPIHNDKVLSLFNDLNDNLSKHINLHFDTDIFNTLPQEKKETLSDIIQEFIKFSLIYSFDMRDFGDIIVYLRNEENHTKLVFKDNGKGLFIENIKLKIQQQYGVSDSVFLGKSDQQLLSFIFKPGFQLMDNETNYSFNLSMVNTYLKQLQASISINSQEHNGVEFVIQIPTIV